MVNKVKTKQEILEEFREQWRQEVHARGKDPSIDQKRYETLESIQEFKFIQTGAAIRIQRAFRRWPKRNKEKWKKKYKKMIIKYQAQKRLYQAIQKSKTIKFNQHDLENPVKVKNASAMIITRLVRGFLGRRRFHRIHQQITEEKAKKTFAVTKLQAFARKIIVWQRYPTLGYRYRLFRKKQLLFSQQSPDSFFELIPVMKTNLRTITRSSSIGILASSSKDENELIQLGPVKYPDSFQPHQRRSTILFPKLKISSNIDLLAEKVLIVQCAFRIFKAKKVYERRLEAKKQACLIILQRWTRRCLTRFKFLRFLSFAQPIWHENAQAKARRIEAAIKIQSIVRSFIRYRLYQRYVHKRDYARRTIQRWCYYRVCVHKIRLKVQLHRYYHELRLAGDLLYRQTELRWLCFYTWEGIKKTRNIEKVNHELQKIFTSHSLATGMDVAKTIKIMKDCKTLFQGSNNDFTLNSIELQYMKVKSTNEKRIDYNTFLELLCNLMILKEFRIDPPKNIWDMNDDEVIYVMKRDSSSNNNTTSKTTAKIPGGINTSSSPDTVSIKQLRQFRFGDNFTGRTAFILKFVIKYLSTASDYIKVVEYLGNKSASGQVQMLLTSNIRIIQQFIRNRSIIKQLNQSLKHYQTQKKLLKQLHAIKRIQAIVKRFLSKRMVMKIAQQIYHKFIDGESEREYWFNPRNNTSFWKKPLLLGTLDCGIAIRMPTELEKYVINCNICENNYSTCYCKDCQYCYCTSCYTTSHRAGNRNKHSYLHIDNCIQCDFQIGTKYCYTCKDLYCDSCFYYMHKKGRLRFHSYQKYTDLCDQCLRYSAQVEENSYNKQGVQIKQYYCNICYHKEYSILPKDRIKELKHNSQTGTYNNQKKRYYQCKIHLIQYYGRQVREYHEKLLEEKKKLEIQQMYEKRLNELAEIKRLTSIQTIQRIYRGYKKRQEIKDFIQQRKEFLKLREEENQYRNAWTTKLLGWMGFPQIFESDTPLEKVHKLYPWYMHHIVAECIENQWNDACQMLIEHDEYLIGKPKATLLQYLSARINVYFNQKKYQKVCDIYNAKVLLVNTAKENYYNAEASGAFAEGKLKKMKQAVNALQKELNLIEKEQNEAYSQLAQAETALMDCVGPRRLQTLVETRRAHGIPLPFKVSIRKHSRYALVEYIDQSNSSHAELPLDEELGVTSPHSDSRGGDMSVLTHQPGEWKKKLKTGDTVVLQGIHYQIIPSMNEKKKSSKKNKSGKGGDNSGLDNSESGTVASSKKKKTGTSVKKDDSNSHKDDSQKGKDYSESGKNDGNTTTNNNTANNDNNPLRKFDEPIEGQELRETVTANHIVLDHPWMLDDVYGIDIHKMPSTVFYYKPVKFIQRYLIRTYVTQKIIAILAIYNHKLSLLFQYLITFFDEETSSSYLFCQTMITRSIRSRNYYLSLSIYIIVLSFDFTLRRKIGRQFYRIYQLFMMIARNIYNIYATLTSNLSETPYEYWQRSLEKENIQAVYEVNGNESIVLGEFRMDIKAPVEIMREYINRRYRNVLNQSVGASYIFMRINEETGREEYCLRDDEFSIYSKDFVIMKTDPKTFESLLTVTIVKDKDRGKIFIPEYKDDFDDIGSLEKHKDDANADDQDNGSLV